MNNIPEIHEMILLPGMDGTGDLFVELVQAMRGEFNVISRVSYPPSLVCSEVHLLETLRSTAATAHTFLLVAESFSTPLAIAYAATRPEQLRGLVICAGFVTSPVNPLLRVCAMLFAPVLARMRLPDSAIRRWLVGERASASLLRSVSNSIGSVRPTVMASRLRMVLRCDVRAQLAQVSVPVLYLQANGDRLVGKSSTREFLAVKPDTLLQGIDGPHLLLQVEPEKTAQVIRDFVKQFSA